MSELNQSNPNSERMPAFVNESCGHFNNMGMANTMANQSAIARDVASKRAQAVPDHGSKQAALGRERLSGTAFVQSFQGLVDHWIGYLVLVTHESEHNGQHVSNSAAVRVDNIGEVVRVLEVLFKR